MGGINTNRSGVSPSSAPNPTAPLKSAPSTGPLSPQPQQPKLAGDSFQSAAPVPTKADPLGGFGHIPTDDEAFTQAFQSFLTSKPADASAEHHGAEAKGEEAQGEEGSGAAGVKHKTDGAKTLLRELPEAGEKLLHHLKSLESIAETAEGAVMGEAAEHAHNGIHFGDILGGHVAQIAGAFQVADGLGKLTRAKAAHQKVEGASEAAAGLTNVSAGIALVGGAAKIAGHLGGVAAIVEGGGEVAAGLMQKNKNWEQVGLGAAKTVGGAMLFAPPPIDVAGAAVLAGVGIFELGKSLFGGHGKEAPTKAAAGH